MPPDLYLQVGRELWSRSRVQRYWIILDWLIHRVILSGRTSSLVGIVKGQGREQWGVDMDRVVASLMISMLFLTHFFIHLITWESPVGVASMRKSNGGGQKRTDGR